MPIVYEHPLSPYVQKVKIALGEKGVEFETRMPDILGGSDRDELVKLNPQIYLASSDSGTTLALLRKDPQLRKVDAIHSGRFAFVPRELLEPGPRIGEALLQLAAAIHAGAH